MKRIVFAAVALVLLVFVSGCERPCRVESYSNGQKVGEWKTNRIPRGTHGHLWFTDENGRHVEVAGDFVVTEIPKE